MRKSPKCKSCTTPSEPHPVTEMQFTAHRRTVVLSDGSRANLNRAFINPLYKPGGGWTFQFILNGAQHTISRKKRPEDVASEVIRIHADNNKPVNTWDVWLNLNLYWLSKTDRLYWLVSPTELADAATANSGAESVAMSQVHPPQVWGSRAWNWMGIYLAGNSYDPNTFLTITQHVLDLLDPARNPTTGCQLCYLEFTKQVTMLKNDPPETRQAAREWLWSFHNLVNKRLGKRELTYVQASKENFWTP